MQLDNQTKEQLRKLFGPFPQVSKRRARIVLAVVFCLFVVWLVGAFYFYQQVETDKAVLEQKRIEANRRQESARRQATYQRALEQYQAPQTRTQRYGM